MHLEDLKLQWNDVLDDLEARDRVAWLAVFDGRLASLEGSTLVLDFSDVTKFANPHEFERATNPRFLAALADSIERICAVRVVVHTVDAHGRPAAR